MKQKMTLLKYIFNYENNNIIAILDENKKVWCKAKEVAIALGYRDFSRAITKNVSLKYKSRSVMWNVVYNIPIKYRSTDYIHRSTGIFQPIVKNSQKKNVKNA